MKHTKAGKCSTKAGALTGREHLNSGQADFSLFKGTGKTAVQEHAGAVIMLHLQDLVAL